MNAVIEVSNDTVVMGGGAERGEKWGVGTETAIVTCEPTSQKRSLDLCNRKIRGFNSHVF